MSGLNSWRRVWEGPPRIVEDGNKESCLATHGSSKVRLVFSSEEESKDLPGVLEKKGWKSYERADSIKIGDVLRWWGDGCLAGLVLPRQCWHYGIVLHAGPLEFQKHLGTVLELRRVDLPDIESLRVAMRVEGGPELERETKT